MFARRLTMSATHQMCRAMATDGMEMDATIGVGDINIIKLKYDESMTTTFTATLILSTFYDITF